MKPQVGIPKNERGHGRIKTKAAERKVGWVRKLQGKSTIVMSITGGDVMSP